MLLFENPCCGGFVGDFMMIIIGIFFSLDQRWNMASAAAVFRVGDSAGMAESLAAKTELSRR